MNPPLPRTVGLGGLSNTHRALTIRWLSFYRKVPSSSKSSHAFLTRPHRSAKSKGNSKYAPVSQKIVGWGKSHKLRSCPWLGQAGEDKKACWVPTGMTHNVSCPTCGSHRYSSRRASRTAVSRPGAVTRRAGSLASSPHKASESQAPSSSKTPGPRPVHGQPEDL